MSSTVPLMVWNLDYHLALQQSHLASALLVGPTQILDANRVLRGDRGTCVRGTGAIDQTRPARINGQ